MRPCRPENSLTISVSRSALQSEAASTAAALTSAAASLSQR